MHYLISELLWIKLHNINIYFYNLVMYSLNIPVFIMFKSLLTHSQKKEEKKVKIYGKYMLIVNK